MRHCLKITPEALDSLLVFAYINYIKSYIEVNQELLE